MICPNCRSECDREEVDIGVGTLTGPWHCNNCGWSQDDGTASLIPALVSN